MANIVTHYAHSSEPLRLQTDYVVVGSGAGGASAALALARGGAHVTLVEAGPWRDPDDYPSSSLGAMRDLFDQWGSLLTRGRAFWPIVQGCAVGGTTVINSAICVRTPADIFSQWRRDHGIDGLEDAVGDAQDALEEELSATPVPELAAGESNRLAMVGSEALGIEGHPMTRYVRNCAGSGQCLQGCREGHKQSLNVAFVPQLFPLDGVVLSCAPVRRILFDGKRAQGVQGWFRHPQTRKKGAPFQVLARRAVVVAASATHSPALLLRSGVRHPSLGRYFRAHPGTAVFGVYDQPVDANKGATQGWASMEFRERPGFKLETLSIPLEMVASRFSGAGRTLMERLQRYRHVAMWVHASRAQSHGRVSHGWGGQPVVRYTLDADDMDRFRHGAYQVARLHFAAGAKAVLPGIVGLPFELGPSQVDEFLSASLDPRSYTAILSHLFGGCVMGGDPTDSVCDTSGRVRGYDGLCIADASAIPTVLGVNPQHTIMALARVWAQRWLAED